MQISDMHNVHDKNKFGTKYNSSSKDGDWEERPKKDKSITT